MTPETAAEIEVYPRTPERWSALEQLFTECRECQNCWCMAWRIPRSTFGRQAGGGNRNALHSIVDAGTVPGLLGYKAGHPVGWCAIGPRSMFPVLDRSPILKPVDDTPVWSIVCFYVARRCRRQGLSVWMLRSALAYAAAHGATIVEGYPFDPPGAMRNAWAFTGLASAFRTVGFTEVLRRSAQRPIMRYVLGTASHGD